VEIPEREEAGRAALRGAQPYRLRLWRARLRSFFFLCFRIFLRRFLMTLPTVGAPPCGSREG